MNIQRGRDHGLATYNEARLHMGLEPAASFAAVSSSAEVQARLAAVYRNVDEVELWIGSLAEDRLPGTLVGETASVVLKEQFEALRDGDRFWYARDLRGAERRAVEATTLADIIRRNTTIGKDSQCASGRPVRRNAPGPVRRISPASTSKRVTCKHRGERRPAIPACTVDADLANRPDSRRSRE